MFSLILLGSKFNESFILVKDNQYVKKENSLFGCQRCLFKDLLCILKTFIDAVRDENRIIGQALAYMDAYDRSHVVLMHV